MTKTKPTKRIKRVKAWAVIQPDMQDSMPLAKVFAGKVGFVEAIFHLPFFAEKYAERFKDYLKIKVVPCTITYELPLTKPKK